MYPEAGGSASFARHAFNEVVSFIAGWGQMLNYIITAAISAFFVPHYLAVFWPALGHGPGDVIAGIVLVALLAALNVKGTQESSRLNLVLAIGDLCTQILLVVIGIALVLNPSTLVDNVHLGVAPTWGDAALGIAVGMIAYTGIETISNMAEEARDAERTVPRGTAAGGARGARPLRAAAGHRPVGDAGDPGRRRPLLHRAGDDVRRRPGARDRREPGARRGPHGRDADLRRGPGGGDPADRHQRGADRRLAADLLDGPLPPAPRAAAPGSPSLQHALRRDPRLLRGRRADHGAGQDRLPGDHVLVRRHALVHGRARLGAAITAALSRT